MSSIPCGFLAGFGVSGVAISRICRGFFLVGTTNAVRCPATGLTAWPRLAVITLLAQALIGMVCRLAGGVVYVAVAVAGGVLGYPGLHHPRPNNHGRHRFLALGGAIGAMAVLTKTGLLFLFLWA